MKHEIIRVERHHNEWEGSDVFNITFKRGEETHQMLGAADDDRVQVTHSDMLESDSHMDEIIMERMARQLIDNRHIFHEE